MAKHNLKEKDLKRIISNVVNENIDAFGISSDYTDDMQNLANKTGETMDDNFLDSVAHYDARYGDDGPVYPDRKQEEMDADWWDIDDQAKDSQAKYGKNFDELDNLNAFTDTVDQYVNDFNLNAHDVAPGLDALCDYDKAETERRHPMEGIVREAIREALKEMYDSYNHPEQSNGNQFATNHGIDAHKFSHNGADAYWARKDQDKMHKKEKDSMKRNTKRSMDAADKRPLHRKGSLNRAFDESKTHMNEGRARFVLKFMAHGYGHDTVLLNDLNDIKRCKAPGIYYWEVLDYNSSNFTDPKALIAWGGEGGYWDNVVNSDDIKSELKNYILSKKKDITIGSSSTNESKSRVNENDDDAFWKQQHQDEMNYEMREFIKAMQQENGTYHATSQDGQFQTGDKVIVHGRNQDITGVIKDFGTHLMTWEETCDVNYDKNGDGKMWTLMSVPLTKIEKASEGGIPENKVRESVNKVFSKMINEEWYPEEDNPMDDYYYGAMMTLSVDGMFDELTPEKVEELNQIGKNGDGPYIENGQKYSSVMVTKVNLVPDGFDGYDVNVEVAVTSPDMPIDAIEEEVEDMVWYWIEEQTGVRSPRVYITNEKVVFDRRTKYAQN